MVVFGFGCQCRDLRSITPFGSSFPTAADLSTLARLFISWRFPYNIQRPAFGLTPEGIGLAGVVIGSGWLIAEAVAMNLFENDMIAAHNSGFSTFEYLYNQCKSKNADPLWC